MRSIWKTMLAVAVCWWTLAGLSSAQRKQDVTHPELQAMDEFLDNHAHLASEINNNPQLVNNPQFLAKHPELKTFLAQHPDIRAELKEDPRLVLREERSYEQGEPIPANELKQFDQFLDSHPQIARDLSRNPRLVDDNHYRAQHPQLMSFLAVHPALRKELFVHPVKFMARLGRYEPGTEKRK